jgi:endogenous inhibitor of DNA gyrase (YacG/DUF329 family)
MNCPNCGRPTNRRYRNRPKGEIAEFVCLDCVPKSLAPKKSVLEDVASIDDALNNELPQGEKEVEGDIHPCWHCDELLTVPLPSKCPNCGTKQGPTGHGSKDNPPPVGEKEEQ